MSRYQAKWDPNRERRITESKIYKESHLFANNKHQRLYLIQKEWFNEWMGFLYGNRDRCPSQIDLEIVIRHLPRWPYHNPKCKWKDRDTAIAPIIIIARFLISN